MGTNSNQKQTKYFNSINKHILFMIMTVVVDDEKQTNEMMQK